MAAVRGDDFKEIPVDPAEEIEYLRSKVNVLQQELAFARAEAEYHSKMSHHRNQLRLNLKYRLEKAITKNTRKPVEKCLDFNGNTHITQAARQKGKTDEQRQK